MQSAEPVILKRDVEATMVPAGVRVTLLAGEPATITQALGGSYTVVVNGNMFRLDARDADALGLAAPAAGSATPGGASAAPEPLEKRVWAALRTCYDPEIPVNIVDLGLVYDCRLAALPGAGHYRVDVKMTLTAPGCGMGPVLQQDVQNKILSLEEVDEANIELVWDPPWNQSMLSESAKLQLGFL